MNDATKKRISTASLVFTIVWFVFILLLEVRYVTSVVRHQQTFHNVLGTIYEDQIEGINFVLVIVFLIPGFFAWAVHRRFRRKY